MLTDYNQFIQISGNLVVGSLLVFHFKFFNFAEFSISTHQLLLVNATGDSLMRFTVQNFEDVSLLNLQSLKQSLLSERDSL